MRIWVNSNQRSVQHKFDLKSQVWLHETKFTHYFIMPVLKSQNSIPQMKEFLVCKNAFLIQ